MSQPHMQALTLAPASVRISALNPGLVGSTDTSVLRFGGAPTIVGTAIGVVTSAENGSIFAITERGLYIATLIGFTTAADGTSYGVSKNGTGTVLTAAPTIALSPTQILEAGSVLPVVGQGPAFKLSVAFSVSSAEAGVAGGALIRFHATDDGGTPPGEITAASVLATLTRINDYQG